MQNQENLQLLEDQLIRAAWNEEEEKCAGELPANRKQVKLKA